MTGAKWTTVLCRLLTLIVPKELVLIFYLPSPIFLCSCSSLAGCFSAVSVVQSVSTRAVAGALRPGRSHLPCRGALGLPHRAGWEAKAGIITIIITTSSSSGSGSSEERACGDRSAQHQQAQAEQPLLGQAHRQPRSFDCSFEGHRSGLCQRSLDRVTATFYCMTNFQ